MKPTDRPVLTPEEDPLAFNELEEIMEELKQLEEEWLSRELLEAGEPGDQ